VLDRLPISEAQQDLPEHRPDFGTGLAEEAEDTGKIGVIADSKSSHTGAPRESSDVSNTGFVSVAKFEGTAALLSEQQESPHEGGRASTVSDCLDPPWQPVPEQHPAIPRQAGRCWMILVMFQFRPIQKKCKEGGSDCWYPNRKDNDTVMMFSNRKRTRESRPSKFGPSKI
jgi:hypothetical protein